MGRKERQTGTSRRTMGRTRAAWSAAVWVQYGTERGATRDERQDDGADESGVVSSSSSSAGAAGGGAYHCPPRAKGAKEDQRRRAADENWLATPLLVLPSDQ